MNRATVNDVQSRSYRVIERALLAPMAALVLVAIVVLGAGALTAWAGGTEMTAEAGSTEATVLIGAAVAGFAGPILLFGVAVALLSIASLAVIVGVYFDAETIEAADVGWQPNPVLFMLVTLFFQPFAFYYLYKRHQYVVDWVDSGRWATVAGVSAVLSTLFVVAGLVLDTVLGRMGLALVLVGLGAIVIAPFPYALYRDSTYVRLNSGSWQPNPGLTLPVALGSLLLGPIGYLPVSVFYLVKRRGALAAA